MCKNIKLIANQHGCISLCKDCNEFQIIFGTTLLSISNKQFYEIITKLYRLRKKGDSFPLHQKSIYIRTSLKNVAIIVSPYELENLIDLFETAIYNYLIAQALTNIN